VSFHIGPTKETIVFAGTVVVGGIRKGLMGFAARMTSPLPVLNDDIWLSQLVAQNQNPLIVTLVKSGKA
jgi:hypothetical protein